LRLPAPKQPARRQEAEPIIDAPEVEVVEAEKPRRKPRRVVREFDEDDEPEEDTPRERRPRRRKLRRRRQESFDLLEAMPLSYQAQANLGILLAILVHIAGFVLLQNLGLAGLPLYLVGYLTAVLFWFWGCAAYARNKGHSAWYGFLGFLGLIGLIVLVLLPYKQRD
jgi:hypothetical protein